ncbi:MAG: hypothetical protein PF503_23145 [Desulfobacula sp.]|jgi:hypothetical protein|nr:hypothetical protein [Desulfobacula sp.]
MLLSQYLTAPVISTILIKKVELEPRQMTFGFEDRMSKNMDTVFSFIEKEYQIGGADRPV